MTQEPEAPVIQPVTQPRAALAALLARREALAGPVIFGLFCLGAVAIWLPGGGDPVPQAGGGAQDLNARLAEGRERIAALIPAIAERPLFQADRRPLAAPEAPAPPPEAVLLLVGILGDGDERIALLRLSTGEDLYQVEPGGRLGRWQVLSIEGETVLVQPDGEDPVPLRLGG
jgi:hypothetical protein